MGLKIRLPYSISKGKQGPMNPRTACFPHHSVSLLNAAKIREENASICSNIWHELRSPKMNRITKNVATYKIVTFVHHNLQYADHHNRWPQIETMTQTVSLNSCITTGVIKVKQSRCTPWRRLRERRYSSYSFTTSALDGVSGQRHTPAVFYPRGKDSIVQEAG
jgi:hypothetical protein